MKKVSLIIFALMILAGVMLFMRGDEDTWLCDKEKGEWVKHGAPSAPMPTEVCGESKPALIPSKTDCEAGQRNADVCFDMYRPVCATVNIQCFTVPCNPIEETYPNSCEACKNSLVSSYKEGACK